MKDLSSYNKTSLNSNSFSFSIFDKLPSTANPFTSKPRYADLEIFRQLVEESKAGLHHQPYSSHKKKTHLYKSVFFGFAILFFILEIIALAIPSALGCGFLFSSCSFLKGIIVSICTVFSVSSLTLALRLKAEKEAVASLIRKARIRLAAIYARKKVRSNLNFFSFFLNPARQKAAALKLAYYEVYDKMNDKKEESLHLVHRISTAETLNAHEKEDLLNQAIEELNDQLQHLTTAFRHAG